MTIQVRPYTAADTKTLIALFRGSVRQIARSDYSAEQVTAWAPDQIDAAEFAARCTAKETWVAECQHAIAGFSDLEPDGHIDRMYVHADHQGKGVATALLSHIEARAKAGGMPRLCAEVSITARPFFARRGFVVTRERDVILNGQHFINYAMEKALG